MTDQSAPLRIGTRGSPLALAQAHQTRDLLMAAHGLPEAAFEITVIQTTGDAVQWRPLSEIGGKGLFTKELEEALAAGAIDLAVHSMKDVATVLPDGMEITCMLEREDVRDALVSPRHGTLDDLPQGATFGSSSLRRRAQLLHRRPDLNMVEFRGSVQTRMRKLEEGVAEATLLARAGLNRLGHSALGTTLDEDVLLPAVAQGAIGIEQMADDDRVRDLLAPINHAETLLAVSIERAFLARLDGSCRTPIAGLARRAGSDVAFRGEVLRPDGSEVLRAARSGPPSDGPAMAVDAANEVLGLGAAAFF